MIIKSENGKEIRRFVPIRDGIKTPKAATKYSAGYDIYATENYPLSSGEAIVIRTGLRYETTNPDEVVMIYPRSSVGFKNYIRLANTVGVIDSDYEGEILIKIRNESYEDEPFMIKKGDAIAQAVIMPFIKLSPDVRDNEERGKGGIGSTGK